MNRSNKCKAGSTASYFKIHIKCIIFPQQQKDVVCLSVQSQPQMSYVFLAFTIESINQSLI